MPLRLLRRALWAATALPLLLGSAPVGAQSSAPDALAGPAPMLTRADGPLTSPAAFVGFNVWVGAVSAAVRAQRRGARVLRAALAGAAGGAVTAAGQRLIGVGPAGLRFAGLQLVALGANVGRNAGEGVPVLSDVILPLYPLYLRVQPGATHPVRVRVSAMALRGLAVAAVQRQSRIRFDPMESLRTGAPVFRSPLNALPLGSSDAGCIEQRCVVGLHLTGAIIYAGGSDPRLAALRGETLRHEASHLAQFARDGVLFGVPASDRLLAAGGRPGRWLRGWLVADVALPLLGADLLTTAATSDPDVQSLYEREVRAMMR